VCYLYAIIGRIYCKGYSHREGAHQEYSEEDEEERAQDALALAQFQSSAPNKRRRRPPALAVNGAITPIVGGGVNQNGREEGQNDDQLDVSFGFVAHDLQSRGLAPLALSRSPRPPNVADIGSFAFHSTVCYTC